MIAIKGMTMPECCDRCTLLDRHTTGGLLCAANNTPIWYDDIWDCRADTCPLMEVKE